MQSPWRFLLMLPATVALLSQTALSAVDTAFVYVGCSPLKYAAGTAYDSAVNSMISSLVNSASVSPYNTFNISVTASSSTVLYGLFQCRGDISNAACFSCVSAAASRLGSTCAGASGGALQLEGCYVRYDNVSFVGVEEKTVVVDRCGPDGGNVVDVMGEKDAVLGNLVAGVGPLFRTAASGRVRGVAQCVQDLSVGQCQDCLSEAIQRLRSECRSSAWGDMFLSKCYARFYPRGVTSPSSPIGNEQEEVQRDLAILIGLIAGVTVLVVFVSFFSRLVDRSDRNRDGK